LGVPVIPSKEDREDFGFNIPINEDVENLENPTLMQVEGDTVEAAGDDMKDVDPKEEEIDRFFDRSCQRC